MGPFRSLAARVTLRGRKSGKSTKLLYIVKTMPVARLPKYRGFVV